MPFCRMGYATKTYYGAIYLFESFIRKQVMPVESKRSDESLHNSSPSTELRTVFFVSNFKELFAWLLKLFLFVQKRHCFLLVSKNLSRVMRCVTCFFCCYILNKKLEYINIYLCIWMLSIIHPLHRVRNVMVARMHVCKLTIPVWVPFSHFLSSSS